ncbi:MAG: hypothetical protein GY713_00060 [Actinomycetia bacterium]|nr:hypothetical protein [Actinomycetes bacterium]
MLTHQAQLVRETDLALALLEAWDAERPIRREIVLRARTTGEVSPNLADQLDRLTDHTNDLLHRAETGTDERALLTAAQVWEHRRALVGDEHPSR